MCSQSKSVTFSHDNEVYRAVVSEKGTTIYRGEEHLVEVNIKAVDLGQLKALTSAYLQGYHSAKFEGA